MEGSLMSMWMEVKNFMLCFVLPCLYAYDSAIVLNNDNQATSTGQGEY